MNRRLGMTVAAVSLIVAACSAGAAPSAAVPSPPPGAIYTVSPPAGTTPSKDDTNRAVEVLSARLRALGLGTFTATAGADITFTIPAPLDDAEVQAVLSATGHVSFVPLGRPGGIRAVEGQPLPTSPAPLFGADQIASASAGRNAGGGPEITIRLKDAGARLLADYTSTHVGDQLAIVLDGRVVVLPVIQGPIVDGDLTITGGTERQVITIAALAAILASGPLPDAWRQTR